MTSIRRRLEALESLARHRAERRERGGDLFVLRVVRPNQPEPPPIPAEWLAEQQRIADERGFYMASWPPGDDEEVS